MPLRGLLLLPLLLVLALVVATSAGAESPGRKIVVFRSGVDFATQVAAVRGAGGTPIKPVRLVNATVAELNSKAADALSRRPDVVRVDDDAVVEMNAAGQPPDVQAESAGQARGPLKKRTPTPIPTPTPDPSPAPTSTAVPTSTPTTIPTSTPAAGPSPTPTSSTEVVPWGIARIDAPQSWSTSRGDLVRVGVVDTGISLSHPDLAVAGGVSEVSYTTSYDDDNGHGSHVSGIIAALDSSYGVVGTAPMANLYALKALDRNGSGYISDLINVLDWAMANGIQVVNMSLGTGSDIQSFHDAIIQAYNAGIVMVAAAGNSGPGNYTVTYPAAYREVIAVSAVGGNDNIASFSSIGPQVDLAAPGDGIYSTYKGTAYATMSGTSMASPHVAGVAALRKHLHPAESPGQVAAVLKGNADVLPGLTPDQQGAGLVDAYRAATAP